MVPSTDVGAAASQTGTNLIDFDLSHLSLDLAAPAPSVQSAQSPSSAPEDPKLALAEEYLSIGDKHGARSLIEEVIVQNSHPASVAQAEAMLARLS